MGYSRTYKNPALGTKLQAAKSEADVIALLDTGMKRYVNASPKTKRRWSRIAGDKIEELNAKK